MKFFGFERKLKLFNIKSWDECKRRTDFSSIRITGFQEVAMDWWASPLQTNYTDMYFLHSEDAMLFKLKFGGE